MNLLTRCHARPLQTWVHTFILARQIFNGIHSKFKQNSENYNSLYWLGLICHCFCSIILLLILTTLIYSGNNLCDLFVLL